MESPASDAPAARGKRILVIDDAVTVRLYCRHVLEAEGHFVEEAVNGVEGLEKALSQPFDLLLVDINMPRMDGYAMLHQVRRQADIGTLPAIMVSTEEREADTERAYAAGANFYMAKPIRPQPLLDVVRLILGETAP